MINNWNSFGFVGTGLDIHYLFQEEIIPFQRDEEAKPIAFRFATQSPSSSTGKPETMINLHKRDTVASTTSSMATKPLNNPLNVPRTDSSNRKVEAGTGKRKVRQRLPLALIRCIKT